MSPTPAHLQNLYQAFLKSHLLWFDQDILGLKQFEFPLNTDAECHRTIDKRLRLGQLVEQLVFNQLERTKEVTLLAENLQIQKDKQTLGELDLLMTVNERPIHLEIIYKFYLFDPSLDADPLTCWIGPNRKDSLIDKLDKLITKQLPLLHSDACKTTLKEFGLAHLNFEQQVLFKAQLFVPYAIQLDSQPLNPNCIAGYYLRKHQLPEIANFTFFIPAKQDWLLEPHPEVAWMSFKTFIATVSTYHDKHQSPMLWIKNNDSLSKAFMVWW